MSAAVNISLNLALIPRYGVGAAVFATFVAEILNALLVNAVLRRGLRAAAREPAGPPER